MVDIKIYAVDVRKFIEDPVLFEKEFLKMPPYRREKIKKYKKAEDRALSLGAGIALDGAFEEYIKRPGSGAEIRCGQPAEYTGPVIAYKEYGKPYFENYPDFYFSLSHSGTIAICAVSDREIGCDVEIKDEVDLRIARKVLSEEEKKLFADADEAGKKELFYAAWTAKESVTKVSGKGITFEFTGFSVLEPDADGKTAVHNEITVYEDKTSALGDRLMLKQIHIADGYAGAVCVERNGTEDPDMDIDTKWIRQRI